MLNILQRWTGKFAMTMGGDAMNAWVAAAICAAPSGAVGAPLLTKRALGRLGRRDAQAPLAIAASSGAGAGAAVIAALAAQRIGSGWWWFPALLVWAIAITAAATCDALTMRVPSHLLAEAAVATGVLLLVAASGTHDWRSVVVSGIAAAAAGAILVVCWRFFGAGFGDVRLAAAGGLGLGHTSHHAASLGVVAFAVVITCGAIATYVRTHDRNAQFPYGPGLVAGFLTAAAAG